MQNKYERAKDNTPLLWGTNENIKNRVHMWKYMVATPPRLVRKSISPGERFYTRQGETPHTTRASTTSKKKTRVVYAFGRHAERGPRSNAWSVVGMGVHDAAGCHAIKCLGGFAGSLALVAFHHSNRSKFPHCDFPRQVTLRTPPVNPFPTKY